MTNVTLKDRPNTRNLYVASTLRYGGTGRFDEVAVVRARSRRVSLLCRMAVLLAIGSGVLGGFANEALSPFDDAVYWFRGGVDASGNGILDSGSSEFRDVVHAAEPSNAQHVMNLLQKDTATYDPLLARTGKVVMAAAGNVLSDAPYLHLPQRFVTNGVFTATTGVSYVYGQLHANYVSMPNLFVDLPSDVDCTNYTVFLRFRDVSKVSERENEHGLFQCGYNWGGKCGISINLNDAGSYVQPKLYAGQMQTIVGASDFQIPYNRWCDLAVSVEGSKILFGICPNVSDADVVTNRLVSFTTVTASSGQNPAVLSSRRYVNFGGEASGITGIYTNGYVYQVKNASGGLVNGGTHDEPSLANKVKSLRGDLQTFAFWRRALTTNEIRQVLCERRPAIVQMGLANGSSSEFAGSESTVDANGFHPENWNPVLNAAHPSATATFTVVDGEQGVSQYLRVRPVPSSAVATVKIELDGAEIAIKTMLPDRDALVYIPAAKMTVGAHTLAFTRTDSASGDFAIDAFRIYGSWRIGTSATYGGMVHETNYPYQYSNPRVFRLTDGNMNHFARGFSGSASGDNSTHTIPFDFPGSWVGKMKDATFSFKLGDGSAQTFEVLLNGVLLQTIASASAGKEYSVAVPSSAFVAGENVLTFRKTTANGGTWINCPRYQLSLGKMVSGFFLILR